MISAHQNELFNVVGEGRKPVDPRTRTDQTKRHNPRANLRRGDTNRDLDQRQRVQPMPQRQQHRSVIPLNGQPGDPPCEPCQITGIELNPLSRTSDQKQDQYTIKPNGLPPPSPPPPNPKTTHSHQNPTPNNTKQHQTHPNHPKRKLTHPCNNPTPNHPQSPKHPNPNR